MTPAPHVPRELLGTGAVPAWLTLSPSQRDRLLALRRDARLGDLAFAALVALEARGARPRWDAEAGVIRSACPCCQADELALGRLENAVSAVAGREGSTP